MGSAASSDHLCEPDGGRVRFVNSTVRYHMGSSAANTLWVARTRLEQVLMVMVSGLILTVSILFIIIGKTQDFSAGSNPASGKISNQSLCLSPQCVKVAAAILSDLDDDIDPCDDFYKVRKLLFEWIFDHVIEL